MHHDKTIVILGYNSMDKTYGGPKLEDKGQSHGKIHLALEFWRRGDGKTNGLSWPTSNQEPEEGNGETTSVRSHDIMTMSGHEKSAFGQ